MKCFLLAAVFCVFARFPLSLHAASPSNTAPSETAGEPSALPEVPMPSARAAAPRADARPAGMSAFSALGFDVKSGVGGVGFDVATPLGRHFNLRAGASFFNFNIGNLNLLEGGFAIEGTLKLQTVNTCIDYYPMGDSFRISPGVTVNNGNNFTGTGLVPPGGTITLNGADYTSSSTDPLIATFSTPANRFGHRIAPSITTGVGSIIPRGAHKHWSIPVELGIEYIAPPKVVFGLTGTACTSTGCGSVASDPTTQANLKAQQAIVNSDLYNLRFFPIFSMGIGYKF